MTTVESNTLETLSCRLCGATVEAEPVHVCDQCFGPLEVRYPLESLRGRVTREMVESRPTDLWRYRELLPLEEVPRWGHGVGWTPLLPAPRLGAELGIDDLWIKVDSVNYPTQSFKDRVVAVALNRAREFGLDRVGCASTGNLANAVAAQAAAAGLEAWIFIPQDLEPEKIVATGVHGARVVRIDGIYDDVNRLCAEVSDRFGWGIVNVNLRPYYSEGSKTVAYEIAEQLGWRIPGNVVVPMAGGSLITKIEKGFHELGAVGLVDGSSQARLFGAQASGCSPIVSALERGDTSVAPVRPDTIARSLAIGNPADGPFAVQTMRRSGGGGAAVSDDEIREGIGLLARLEGVFTETAGGVTVAAAGKLASQGRFADADGPTVLCITGNGLKTPEVARSTYELEEVIEPRLREVERLAEAYAESSP